MLLQSAVCLTQSSKNESFPSAPEAQNDPMEALVLPETTVSVQPPTTTTVRELVYWADRALQTPASEFVHDALVSLFLEKLSKLKAEDLPELLSLLEDEELNDETRNLIAIQAARIIESDPDSVAVLRKLANDPANPSLKTLEQVFDLVDQSRMPETQRNALGALGKELLSTSPSQKEVELTEEEQTRARNAAGSLPDSLETTAARRSRIGRDAASRPMSEEELLEVNREVRMRIGEKDETARFDLIRAVIIARIGKKNYLAFFQKNEASCRDGNGDLDSNKLLLAFGREYPQHYGNALYDLWGSLGCESVNGQRQRVGSLVLASTLGPDGSGLKEVLETDSLTSKQKAAVLQRYVRNPVGGTVSDRVKLIGEISRLLEAFKDDPEMLLKGPLQELAFKVCEEPASTQDLKQAQGALFKVLLKDLVGDLQSGDTERVSRAAGMFERISRSSPMILLMKSAGIQNPRQHLAQLLLAALDQSADRQRDVSLVQAIASTLAGPKREGNEFSNRLLDNLDIRERSSSDLGESIKILRALAVDKRRSPSARSQAVEELYRLNDVEGLELVGKAVRGSDFERDFVSTLLHCGDKDDISDLQQCARKMGPAFSILAENPILASEYKKNNFLLFSPTVNGAKVLWTLENRPGDLDSELSRLSDSRISASGMIRVKFYLIESIAELRENRYSETDLEFVLRLSDSVLKDGEGENPALVGGEYLDCADRVLALYEERPDLLKDPKARDRLEAISAICNKQARNPLLTERAADLEKRAKALRDKAD